MTSYSSDQVEEVWSWIHDERRCVTTQTVSLTMGLPRTAAASLLQNLPSYKENDSIYECTKCCLAKEDGATVVKLVKSTVDAKDTVDTSDGPIYSIALVQAETLRAAHQKDMVMFRDMLQSDTNQALDSALHTHDVVPSVVDQIQRLDLETSREQRGTVAAPRASGTSVSTAGKMQTKRKATSAASFFQAKKTNNADAAKEEKASSVSASNSLTVGTKKAGATKPAAKKESLGTNSKSAIRNPVTSKKADGVEEPPQDDASDNNPVDFSEKENQTNGSADGKKPAAVGDADDFVGDEDEDEEFLVEEEERKRRNEKSEKQEGESKNEAKRVPARRVVVADDADEDEEPKVMGAMDAFATVVKSPPKAEAATTHRKRRKTLVDRTTTDAQGYLHTETIAVWEDVPSDEEETEAAAEPVDRKKVAAKNTKNMKQGNLMGFFQKKK